MNYHSGLPNDTKTIRHQDFISHFKACMNKTRNFNPSQSDIEVMFDHIDMDGSGVIDAWELHHCSATEFLTPVQVQSMINLFKKRNPRNKGKVSITKKMFLEDYKDIVDQIMLNS